MATIECTDIHYTDVRQQSFYDIMLICKAQNPTTITIILLSAKCISVNSSIPPVQKDCILHLAVKCCQNPIASDVQPAVCCI